MLKNKYKRININHIQIAIIVIVFLFLCRKILLHPVMALESTQISVLALVFYYFLLSLWISLPVSLVYNLRHKEFPGHIYTIQYVLVLSYILYLLQFLKLLRDMYVATGTIQDVFGIYIVYIVVMLVLSAIYLIARIKNKMTPIKTLSLAAQSLIFFVAFGYATWKELPLYLL